MLQNAYLDAKIGVDPAENEARKEWWVVAFGIIEVADRQRREECAGSDVGRGDEVRVALEELRVPRAPGRLDLATFESGKMFQFFVKC